MYAFNAADIPLPHNIGSNTLWNALYYAVTQYETTKMLVNDERKVNFVYFLIKTEYYVFLLLLFHRDSRHIERPLDFSRCFTLLHCHYFPSKKKKKKQNKHKEYEPIPKKKNHRTKQQQKNHRFTLSTKWQN